MIDWMKYNWLYGLISALFILPGLISLLVFGVKPSIDFIGGAMTELQLQPGVSLNAEQLNEILDETYAIQTVQSSGSNRAIIRSNELTNDQKNALVAQISENYGSAEVLRFETIGPTLSKELLKKTLAALAIVMLIITLYVAKQFDSIRFGVGAILAMVHDIVIVLGFFSLFGYFLGVEVDVLFVTALLTTLSFSVHDTIVVYDRVRELQKTHSRASLRSIYNTAISETMARSVNNSVTIILMLLALSLLGGDTIRWFAIALLIGAVAGTYSSPFTSVPILWVWHLIEEKRKSSKKISTI